MGEPILQLTNRANWQEVYDETFTADSAGANRFYPLPPIVIPVLLTSPIICLAASSATAPPHYRLAYWARQYIGSTGIGAIEGNTCKAMINRFMLSRFPMLAPQYQLRIDFPRWHQSMSVAIWEYSGPIDDTTDELIREQSEVTRIDLLRVEAKVDQL